MGTASTQATNGTSRHTEASPASLNKRQAILRALMELSLCYPATRTELSEAVQAKYIQRLEDLGYEQLGRAFQRAEEECEMFPSPATLRRLAGLRTVRQCSEDEARGALQWILEKIRIHGRNLAPIRGNLIREGYYETVFDIENGKQRIAHQPEYEMIPCPPPSEKIKRTVEALGNGDKVDGLLQLSQHPGFATKTDGEYGTQGQRFAAIDKFEQRWLRTWEMVNREESTALEVIA